MIRDRDFAHWACGLAAVYFDPKNHVSVGEAILKMSDPEFRDKLVNAGQKQLKKNFSLGSWRNVASSYLSVVEKVVKS